jgi:hypothetical protein
MFVKTGHMKFCVFFVFVVFFIFPGEMPVYGQDVQRHTDTVWLNDQYFIQKDFRYRRSGNDTLLEGRYSLTLKPYVGDTLVAQEYRYESLDINYNNNVKEGPFSLKSFSFHPLIPGLEPKEGHIQVPYRGTSAENRGQFEQNRPFGQWFFSRYEHHEETVVDTLVQVRTAYNREGVPDQQFYILDRNIEQEIRGSFGEGGAFDGELQVWSLGADSSLIISYQFEKGLLSSIRRPGAPPLQPDFFENNGGVDFQEHAMDSLYTKALSYYLQDLPAEDRDDVLQPLQTVFKSFDYLSASYSPLTDHLPGDYDRQYPKVKLPVYEPDSREIEFIRETHNRLTNLYDQTDSLMHISAFSLNRYRDKDLAELYAKGLILRKRVGRQQAIFQVLAGPLLAHINPEWFLKRRLSEITGYDTVQYTLNERQYEAPMDFSIPDREASPFRQYQAYISRLEEVYLEISRRIQQRLENLRLDTRLSENEDKISALSEEIDLLADTLAVNLYNQQIANNYKQAFVDFKENQLAQYANMPARERVDHASALIDCLEKMKVKLENVKRLDKKEEMIDQVYMDTHLNPYTYTETEVRLYERLFSAYQDRLVPYVVEKITPAQNCEDFLRKAENLEILQDFMLGALEGNPGRLDRRARPQDSPETLIKKLNIPVVF